MQETEKENKEELEALIAKCANDEDIKRWSTEIIDNKFELLKKQVDRNHTELTHQIKRIVAENLNVPGFVGEGQKYRNMREYVRG